MNQYTKINDLPSITLAVQEAIALKSDPYKHKHLGAQKTLVMLFFNASLRTRLSTEKGRQKFRNGCHCIECHRCLAIRV